MGKHTKSASNILHNMLVQHPIGYQFDVRSLEEEATNYGYDFSEGAVTGFISRAIRKEIVSVKGSYKPQNSRRTRRLYELVDKQDWAFKPAGIGSYPGREIHGTPVSKYPEVDIQNMPLSDPKREEAHQYVLDIALKNQMKPNEIIKNIINTDPIVHAEDHPIDVGPLEYVYPDPFNETIKLPLSDQLVALSVQLGVIASEVIDLENKPEKTLADYSTNDLIEELRKRVK